MDANFQNFLSRSIRYPDGHDTQEQSFTKKYPEPTTVQYYNHEQSDYCVREGKNKSEHEIKLPMEIRRRLLNFGGTNIYK